MNREILFRAKRVDDGEWVFGDLVQAEGRCGIIPTDSETGAWIEVDPATVGRYTGMKDRNGRKIFEGDIIDSWAGIPDNDEMYIRTVVFDDNYGIMKLNPGTGYTLCRDNSEKLFEVIGNIHDTNFK